MGYETDVANATVVALIHHNVEVQQVNSGDKVTVITNQTRFMANLADNKVIRALFAPKMGRNSGDGYAKES